MYYVFANIISDVFANIICDIIAYYVCDNIQKDFSCFLQLVCLIVPESVTENEDIVPN